MFSFCVFSRENDSTTNMTALQVCANFTAMFIGDRSLFTSLYLQKEIMKYSGGILLILIVRILFEREYMCIIIYKQI